MTSWKVWLPELLLHIVVINLAHGCLLFWIKLIGVYIGAKLRLGEAQVKCRLTHSCGRIMLPRGCIRTRVSSDLILILFR